ncbi:MAG: hypothetical protein JNK02_09465 [Planctomycetes bacterium]|nr:hypothetical protein [Planctomycetota bacterium]
MFLATVFALGATIQTAATAAEPRFEFEPQGAPAWIARLEPGVRPAALERADRAADWADPATLERWRAALAAAAAGANPTARARLSVLALRAGRADDGWRHLAAAAAEPALAAALLPLFLPGIGPDEAAGQGGLAGPLADGVILAPATPPRARPAERGRVERRAMRVSGLRVGEALLALRVAVEPEGVQIDVAHLAGGPARLRVRLPSEPGFRLANEYVNWYRVERPGEAHAIEVRPGDEPHTLYGRFEPDREAPRFALPVQRPALLDSGGLAIRPGPRDGDLARAEALARALAGPPLALEARVAPRGAPAAPDGRSAIEVDLSDPQTADAKLAALLGAIEQFVLR